MQTILFLQYPKCSTCQKAAKWLRENNIEVTSRHIVEDCPTVEELTAWFEKGDLPINKFFNTSGNAYKEGNVKEKVKTEKTSQLIQLLSTNGMLIKRPLLIGEDFVLVGFKEDEWSKKLIK